MSLFLAGSRGTEPITHCAANVARTAPWPNPRFGTRKLRKNTHSDASHDVLSLVPFSPGLPSSLLALHGVGLCA
ncbi:hypothetical protein BHE74_00056950 [Ensete ventricosum]|nr:hypothetical protein GW17_00020611 [Ensete ventricosum]RWW37872.1 hypothetical protein BHE74_00056950 [Ensete ventricosum]RZR93230.1 hypothetical protein BHM03_00021677 [Ensete ventricosum]